MSISLDRAEAIAVDVACTDDMLCATLTDGRTISIPLAWFPRLLAATQKQRDKWEFIGGGIGIHWPAIDEDISIASLLQPEIFMRLPEKPLRPAKPRTEPKPAQRARRRA